MNIEEAIAKLKDDNVHEMILEPGVLISWLEELVALRSEKEVLNRKLDETLSKLDVLSKNVEDLRSGCNYTDLGYDPYN